MEWLLLIFGLLAISIGAALLIGLGWAFAIFEILLNVLFHSNTATGGYEKIQEEFRITKKSNKIIGIILLTLGLLFFFTGLSNI